MAEKKRCPYQQADDGSWIVNSHDLVVAAAEDDETYSSAVSRFLQVPNGMDNEEHDTYRRLIDRYLTPARVSDLREQTEEVARTVAQTELHPGKTFDAVHLGTKFAVRASSAWLGWPETIEEELTEWVEANWAATRSGRFDRTAAVANWYNSIIQRLLDQRRGTKTTDVTSELMDDTSLGRPLTDAEITSILRNWTGGDLGSMALSIGVVLAYLADHPDLQDHLRGGVSDREWAEVLDEILRMEDPFPANRRITTRPAQLGDLHLEQGERLSLNWTAANQDPDVFGPPGTFSPQAHAKDNVVYGRGRHVCPGRDLATMQLRAMVETVLRESSAITPDPENHRVSAAAPAGGYQSVPLVVH